VKHLSTYPWIRPKKISHAGYATMAGLDKTPYKQNGEEVFPYHCHFSILSMMLTV
jgi:hypothetical protein